MRSIIDILLFPLNRQELGIRHNFDINQQEYNCPICQRLSNSVLPITKISFEMSTECQQKCHSREMTKFSQWLAQMEGIVNSNMEIEKSKKILNLVDDIMKLTLKSKTIPPSVIMDTSKASMSLNFALNVMNVSITYYIFQLRIYEEIYAFSPIFSEITKSRS